MNTGSKYRVRMLVNSMVWYYLSDNGKLTSNEQQARTYATKAQAESDGNYYGPILGKRGSVVTMAVAEKI